ncbi:MAG: lipopolysaccharide biosynthesis protein [Hyphomicrobiales bacterium]|nr:lipopolysaccharide biosynthesis protein [Hyphomicrobiales bacterium]
MRVLAAFLVNTLFNFVIGLLVAKFLGPDQFGRFALAAAVGMMIQTVTFEWIRLSAVRFYSERVRDARPELRATLDFAFAIISLVLAVVAIFYVLSGVRFSLSNTLVVLAFCAAIANGMFDYHTALVRARFHDRLYISLVVSKNLLALLLTTGGAFYFKSASMTLAGACIAMASSVFLARRALSDALAMPQEARLRLAGSFATYAVPIVAANALYLAIPLVNRALVTAFHGFSETGQFSLAFDIGTRLIGAIGSALDVLLFQMAVRTDELHGRKRADQQVAKNMDIVFSILLPSTFGLWLILPSVEALIVPSEFRGPFAHYLTLLLPGMLAYGLMNFAINPVFQIRKQTLPLIAAAVATCIANPILIVLLPQTQDASRLAMAQAGAFGIGLSVLAVFAVFSGAQWPKAMNIAKTVAATGFMVLALYPMRSWTPGVLTLATQVVAGALIFGVTASLLDLAGLRTQAVAFLHQRRAAAE